VNAPLAQRQEEIRSSEYLAGAKGETCKLRFVGVCNDNPETTVPCHVHDANFGMAQKAHDTSVIDGCSACHNFLDHGWVGKISKGLLCWHIARGLLETFANRVQRGIAKIKRDRPVPHRDKPTPPRKPPEQRAKVPAGRKLRQGQKAPNSRKLQSRNPRRERQGA